MTAVQASEPAPPRLAALVASRICHDLVSPLGAIANGLELMALTGEASPESELIAESVASANARLRFFRVAYGICGPGQVTARGEIASTLQAISRGGRLAYEWEPSGDAPREEVRPVLLLLQCLETAMPMGGRIRVTREDATWVVTGHGSGMRVDEGLWLALQAPDGAPPDAPGLVQFALLPGLLRDLGRPLEVAIEPQRIVARF
jgi:histidine phosphotransferase ChpT